MLKKLMLTTAVSALMIGGAMAQATSPSPPSPAPAATPSSPAPDAMKADAPKPADASAPKATDASTPKATDAAAPKSTASAAVTQQKPDQWLASKFRGTDVVGADNNKIGDVTDILFDKNGKVEAFIISVGGFLGIGSKEVALAPSSFQVMPAEGNTSYERLKLSMTKDQLQQMAAFEPYSPPVPRQTTGTGTGTGGMGGTATRPATTPPASTAK